MIIIGYPGVCKSVASQKFIQVIDLDSSCIWTEENELTKKMNGFNIDFNTYCNIAESLSKQGYIVCVSSHFDVQYILRKSTEQVYVCYPSKEIKRQWISFLRKRYVEDSSESNLKSLNHVISDFDFDIEDMENSGFDAIELNDGKFLSDVLQESFDNAIAEQEVEEVENESEDNK